MGEHASGGSQHHHDIILAAVRQSLNGAITASERKNAYDCIEEFKHSSESLPFSLSLLTNQNLDPPVTHFALQLLEFHVKSASDTQQRLFLRTKLCELLASTAVISSFPPFCQRKLSAVMASVIQRVYPQEWPDCIQTTFTLAKSSPAVAQIILAALTIVLENSTNREFSPDMPSLRREELLLGFHEEALSITSSIVPFISEASCAENALNALHQLCGFIPLTVVQQTSIDKVLTSMITNTKALSCLTAIFSRKFEVVDFDKMVAVSTCIFTVLHHRNIMDFKDQEGAAVQKAVADLLCAWGNYQVDTVIKEYKTSYSLFEGYVSLLAGFLRHPSLRVFEPTVGVWTHLMKKYTVTQLSPVNLPIEELWNQVFSRSTRAIPASIFIEFEDEAEYKAFHQNVRLRLHVEIPMLINFDLEKSTSVFCAKFSDMLNQYGQALRNTSAAVCDTDPIFYVLESGVWIISEFMRAISEEQLSTRVSMTNTVTPAEATGQLFSQFLSLLDAHEGKSSVLLCKFISMFSAFTKLYKLNPAATLPVILEKIFGYFASTDINIRRAASYTLIEICKAVPSLLLPHFMALYQHAGRLCQSNDILYSEKIHLFEMLVLVSNAMNASDEQAGFLKQILQVPITDWTSAESSALIASSSNIVESIFTSNITSIEGFHTSKIVKTNQMANALLSIAKRVKVTEGKSLFGPYWASVLPNLCNLIRSLHGLWNPELKPRILSEPKVCWLLGIASSEIYNYMGESLPKQKTMENPAKLWLKWSATARDISYHLFATALKQHDAYNIPQNGILQCWEGALVDLPYMEHRHLRLLLTIVLIKFVKLCPKEQYAPLLYPVLTTLFSHLTSRLSVAFAVTSWKKNASATEVIDPSVVAESKTWEANFILSENDDSNNNDETLCEIVHEKVLIELSRAILDLLETILQTPKKSEADEWQKSLQDFVMFKSDPALLLAMVRILCGFLCWKNSQLCCRAVVIVEHVFNNVYKHPAFQMVMGSEVFAIALAEILQQNDYLKQNDLYGKFCALLTNIYTRLVCGIPIKKSESTMDASASAGYSQCVAPRQILLSVPNVPQISNLVETLERNLGNSDAHSKERKQYMRSFLESITKPSSNNKKTKIANLPNRLVLLSKANKQQNNSSLVTGVSLSNLFT